MTPVIVFFIGYILLGVLFSFASYLAGGKMGLWTFVGLFLTTFIPFSITLFGPVPIIVFGGATSMKIVLNITTVAIIAVIVFGTKEHRYGAGLFILLSLICGFLALFMFL